MCTIIGLGPDCFGSILQFYEMLIFLGNEVGSLVLC
jgi:hypothetical protein